MDLFCESYVPFNFAILQKQVYSWVLVFYKHTFLVKIASALYFPMKICCGYSLEVPHWVLITYFLWRNKKNINTWLKKMTEIF